MEHRPARIVIALLIASMSLIGVLASGVVIEPDSIPATFGVAVPMAGDRGQYDMVLIDDSGDEPVVAATVPYLRFDVDHTTVMDALGGGHAAVRINYQRAGWNPTDDGWAWSWGFQWALMYGEGRHDSYATDYTIPGSGRVPDGNIIPQEDLVVGGFYHHRLLHDPAGLGSGVAGGHCFLNHGLQGQPWDTRNLTGIFDECAFSWAHLQPGVLSGLNYTQTQALGGGGASEYIWGPLHGIGRSALDGHDTVVIGSDDEAFNMWFDADVPYPIRVTHPGSDGYRLAFVLTSFERGTGAPFAPAPDDAPGWEWRSPRAWGPDDSGWGHWSPREAWNVARDDSDVNAFLGAHPAAQVAYAEWTARTEDDEESWEFHWVDGDDGLEASALRAMAPEAAPATLDDLLRSTAPQTRVVTEPLDFTGWQGRPRPSLIPTAVSLSARIGAFADAVPNRLEWYIGYPMNEGYSGSWRDLEETEGPQSGSLEKAFDLSERIVYFDEVGTAWAVTDLEFHDDAADPRLSGGPPPNEALAEAPVPPGITLPLTVAASAGILAAVAALLYYFFPAIKSGAVGLFSRIQGDAVLKHPVRQTIHAFVAENPGAHTKEIHRIVGGGYGALDHHLQRLVAAGKLATYTGGGYTCFFPKQTDRRLLPAAPALRHDTARAVLGVLMQQPGTTGTVLAQQLGIGRATVIHHLHRLQDAGLVESVRSGRSVQLFPTDVAHLAAQVGMAS